MKKIFRVLVNFGYSIMFISLLLIASTILTSYSLKGKTYYLETKNNELEILNVDELLSTHTSLYSISLRNNTLYVYMESDLTKEEQIALFMNIHSIKKENNHDIQIISLSLIDNSTLWANITNEGVSIS